MIARRYETHISEGLLPGTNESIMGIEAYTYMYIDYTKCILSILASKGAPNQNAFIDIFSIYSDLYEVELTAVPNPDGIERIFGKEGAQINSVSLSVPVPDPAILDQIFGVRGRELLLQTTDSNINVSFVVSSNYVRGTLTKDEEDTNTLIDCIRDRLGFFEKASVRGKTIRTNVDTYNFYEEDFHFPVDINNYRMENGRTQFLTAEEFNTIVQGKLAGAYNINKGYITGITNRRDD